MDNNGIYYGDYLQLDKILNAQDMESDKAGKPAHDEMLFIVTHQAYELWFKQILFELEAIRSTFEQEKIEDNSTSLYQGYHLIKRVNTILRVLVEQIDIMETMSSKDFLDFRDFLRPASGFQSIQFKMVEAILGLRQNDRYKQEYYLSQLRPEDVKRVKEVEDKQSLLVLINAWLERMPFLNIEKYWGSYQPAHNGEQAVDHPFLNDYFHIYGSGLMEGEKGNLDALRKLLTEEVDNRKLSMKARRSALFIVLYREFPLLQLPYLLINSLIEADELMARWRFRHLNMVHRIIGARVGTGGSSGKDYLSKSLNNHYVFTEFAEISTFLAERRVLPELPLKLQQRLSFATSEMSVQE